jgi:hypothetical protein
MRQLFGIYFWVGCGEERRAGHGAVVKHFSRDDECWVGRETQIPFGDDNQKDKRRQLQRQNAEYRDASLLRMTALVRSAWGQNDRWDDCRDDGGRKDG